MKTSGVLFVVVGLALATASPAQAKHGVAKDGFYFGMPLTEADRLLQDTAQYETAYRVDTAGTADIFCRFQEHTLYLAHFLDGECCAVEKRAIVTADDRQRMFDAYKGVLGDPYEAADSQDGHTHYAHWRFHERELELTATARTDGAFLLVHEEYDARRAGQQRIQQQRELHDMPQQTDPLTGQPLPLRRQQAEQAAAANSASPGDPVWESAQDKVATDSETEPNGASKSAGAMAKDSADKGQEADKNPPPITGPNDWG